MLTPLSPSDFKDFYLSESDPVARRRLLIHRCATDVELFAATFFAHYCSREFNEFHQDMFTSFRFRERDVRRVRAAPRGSAKSTLATLIKPLHDACYGLERFILILSSTTPLANKKLKDIRNEVQSNRLLRAVYGVRFPKKKVGESEFCVFSFAGQCHFVAVGKGSEVRGIRINEDRPTKVISDDVEYSEEVYNEQVRQKTENWYFEDVGKVGDTGTNFEFVGTVLHKDALLAKLLKNPAYDGKIFKAIISWSDREDLWQQWRAIYTNLDNKDRLVTAEEFYRNNSAEMLRGTKVLWPAKESYLDHMKDLVEIGKRAFMKEKQNEPQGAEDSVFERIHWYKEQENGLFVLATNTLVPFNVLRPVAAVDPATGKKKPKAGALGDFTSLGIGFEQSMGYDRNGKQQKRLFVHHDTTKRLSPTKTIEEMFNLHDKFKFERMAVEINLYRELLMPNIIAERKRREEKEKRQIQIGFYEVEQTENKGERITALEPKVNHGWILFNVALSQTLKSQFEDFPHAEHDDAPDMVEIMWNLVHNRYKPSGVNIDAMAGR